MVRKLLHWLHREAAGIHQAAFLIAASTFGSQLLALIRDRLLAARFGASRELDIYYSAFRVPDLVYVSFGSLVSVTIVIPFLLARLEQTGKNEARKLFDALFTSFCLLMLFIGVIFWFLAPTLVVLTAPGFNVAERNEVVVLMRWLLLSPSLLGLSNLIGSITQAYKRFFIYSLSPILYNLGIIVGIIFFQPVFGLTGLVWGVLLGAALHLLVQLPTLSHLRFLPRPRFSLPFYDLWRVVKLSIPRTITLGSHQIVLLILTALTTSLAPGAVTVFNLALNLQGVPYALIGISYAVAAFPVMVQIFRRGDREEFLEQFFAAARQVIFWSVLVTVFVIVLRAHLVRVVLGAGAFDWAATRLTAAVLAVFILSTTAQGLILLFIRAFYAAGQTWRPLLINLLSSVVIISLAFLLEHVFQPANSIVEIVGRWFRIGDVAGAEILALPLAFSLGLWFNLWLHWRAFRQNFGVAPLAVWRGIWQVFLGAVAGGGTSYIFLGMLAARFGLHTFWQVLGQGLLAGGLGLVLSAGIFQLLDNQEWREMVAAVRGQFWKAETLQPEPEEL